MGLAFFPSGNIESYINCYRIFFASGLKTLMIKSSELGRFFFHFPRATFWAFDDAEADHFLDLARKISSRPNRLPNPSESQYSGGIFFATTSFRSGSKEDGAKANKEEEISRFWFAG